MNYAFARTMSVALLATLSAAPPNSKRSDDAAVKALLTRMERDWDDVAVTRDTSVAHSTHRDQSVHAIVITGTTAS